MTGIDLYYSFAALFIVGVVVNTFLAVRSESILRYMAPFLVLLTASVGYWGLDLFLGTPKAVVGIPGWRGPSFGLDGAVVLGGRVSPGKEVYLLLQEDDSKTPRLYGFPFSEHFFEALQRTMLRHAKQHDGDPWGFRIGAKDLGHGGGAFGAFSSLEDRADQYDFDPPQMTAPPPKNPPAGVQNYDAGASGG